MYKSNKGNKAWQKCKTITKNSSYRSCSSRELAAVQRPGLWGWSDSLVCTDRGLMTPRSYFTVQCTNYTTSQDCMIQTFKPYNLPSGWVTKGWLTDYADFAPKICFIISKLCVWMKYWKSAKKNKQDLNYWNTLIYVLFHQCLNQNRQLFVGSQSVHIYIF